MLGLLLNTHRPWMLSRCVYLTLGSVLPCNPALGTANNVLAERASKVSALR
jgi:hypothetical protein